MIETECVAFCGRPQNGIDLHTMQELLNSTSIQFKQLARRSPMRRSILLLLLLFLFLSLSVVTCLAQQEYVSRYSAFGAFSYLGTPSLNSVQRGFDGDFGVNLRSWLTLGGDFSYANGASTLLPSSLNTATQAKLAPYV